jgi:hypothetical protein
MTKKRTWLSVGDFIDLLYKAEQKGFMHLLSGIRLKGSSRTFSKWNNVTPGSDFWIIPEVKKDGMKNAQAILTLSMKNIW